MALSLYRVLRVVLYFSEGFLEIAVEESIAAKVLWSTSEDRSSTCGLYY